MTNPRRLLIAAVLGLGVIGALVTASPFADAKSNLAPRLRTVTSPTEPGLTLGLSGAAGQLAASTPASPSWTAKAKHEHATIVRLTVNWSSIAPTALPSSFEPSSATDPAYDWAATDAAVRQLTEEGFTTLIDIQDAPTWAEGPNMPTSAAPGTWEPSAADFGEFAQAIATRYDGHTADPLNPGQDLPKVSDWQAWDEPNLSLYLNPQWEVRGGREIAESPTIYRGLDDALYKAVKAVSVSNYVISAGTAPYGDPPGGARMAPVTFDRYLLCLNAEDQPTPKCAGSTYFDAIDDHPYVSGLCCEGPTEHAALPDDTAPPDVYKIVDILRAAERAHTAAPGGPKGIWATEIAWNTDPPNPNASEASPAATVGRWATQALYVLWSQGVDTILWFQLVDDPKASSGWGQTLTEGLYYVTGKAKPAAAAFAFPFLTNRRNPSSVEAWGRAPKAGTLYVQEKQAGRWVSILALDVRAGQVFEAPIPLSGSASFRAQMSGIDSPPWTQRA